MKNHASVGEVLGPARDLTASRMSIFRTYPDLLQTRSLCLILRTYTISRVCMKSKIPFPLRKIFFEEELDRGGARKCSQKSSFWVEWPTRGLVLPMFSINFAEWAPPPLHPLGSKNLFRNKNFQGYNIFIENKSTRFCYFGEHFCVHFFEILISILDLKMLRIF